MSNSVPGAATTNVVGYFNNQKYPIQLCISRIGITIEVKPGEYILDKKGRKINDPCFDAYRQLSRETSPVPVPLIMIPVQAPVATASDGHAVHQVTEFRMNQKGFREPIMPTPTPREPSAVNNPAIRGMSVEEARRLRLIRPVREIPEDYGVTDTDSAMPPRGPDIPVIKEARDMPVPVAPAAKVAPLPAPLVEAAVPSQAQLQADLAHMQTQAEQLDDDPNGFLNTVVPNPPAVALAAASATEPTPAAPAPAALPLPQLDEELSPSVPASPQSAPAYPWSEEPVVAPSTPAPSPLPPRKKFVCAADGRTFDFRSQLEQHVNRKFPHLREQLMAPYPKA